MLVLTTPEEIRFECERQRRMGRVVGLVPTMGYLHSGHLSLVWLARQHAQFVIVSIFVNPAQFGPNEDFQRYPRDLDGDLAKCRQEGVDLVFAPQTSQIYPPGYQTFVEVERMSQGLCGTKRAGHFRGVTTVVSKLFNIIGPCAAVFGEKDYQQLQIIRRLVADLNFPVEVISHPIVREQDGLAMSSRNAYLKPEHRASANCLFRALQAVQTRVQTAGIVSAQELIVLAQSIIAAEPDTRIDYIEMRDALTLEMLDTVISGRTLFALAVFLGQTRLIDNIVF